MVVASVNIVEEVNGVEQVRETQISTTEFAVKIDGQLYSPAITTEVEIENDGDVSRTRDQCRNTERSRSGNGGWLVRVQGIVTANDGRSGNLSLQMLRDVVASMSHASIRSDVISGRYEVSNVVITESSDLVSVNTKDSEGEEQAFEFQLQLGQSESD